MRFRHFALRLIAFSAATSLSACGGGGSIGAPSTAVTSPPSSGANGGSSSVATLLTVMEPAFPSRGSAPAPTQIATASALPFNVDDPNNSEVTFPLTRTTLVASAGILSADASNESATAIVKASSANSTILQISIPSININEPIAIPGNLATAEMVHSSTGLSYGYMKTLSYVSLGVWAGLNPGPWNCDVLLTCSPYCPRS